jgi:hypothetical protein
MEVYTLIAFVSGISASIYIIASGMSRIISRKNDSAIDKKLDSILNKLDNLLKIENNL